MGPQALLDTCVLYPAYLRDTLLSLAHEGLYRPLWSREIFSELRSNLMEIGIGEATVNRTLVAMATHFDDATVEGHQELIEAMTCHTKDRHVLAAAVHARADTIVTFNLRDFPAESREAYDVSLTTPDDFLLDLLDLAPSVVVAALRAQAVRYKREPKTLAGLLNALSRGGAAVFVDEVRRLAG